MKRVYLGVVLYCLAVASLAAGLELGRGLYIQDQRAKSLALLAVCGHTLTLEQTDDPAPAVQRLGSLTGSRISLFSPDGEWLADSHDPVNDPRQYSYYPEIALARNGLTATRVLRDEDGWVICAASPVLDGFFLLRLQQALPYLAQFDALRLTLWISAGGAGAGLTAWLLGKRYRLPGDFAAAEEDGLLLDSAHQRAEAAEKYANDRISLLSTVFTAMEGGIVLFDRADVPLMMNPQAKSLLGLDSSMFFPGHRQKVTVSPPFDALMDQLKDTSATGEDIARDITGMDDRLLEVRTSLIYNKYQPFEEYGVLAIVMDVTKERMLERLRGEFVTNVSHELRTPLTLISGFVETLKQWEELEPEDRNRALDIIEIETRRLRRLISQLLDLSHIENRLYTESNLLLDPLKALRQMAPSLAAMADKRGMEFHALLPDGSATLQATEGWLEQVVVNLCENAFKYTPKGGRVELGAEVEPQNLRLWVKDNGQGIPAEEQERVFERFYRIDKSRSSKSGGSGLGLAIAQHIVSELGGQITLASQMGVGSEFVVILPLQL